MARRYAAAFATLFLMLSCAHQRSTDSGLYLEVARLEPQTAAGNAAAQRLLEQAPSANDPAFEGKAGFLLLERYEFDAAIVWLTTAMKAGDHDAASEVASWYTLRDARLAFDAVKHTGDDEWLARLAYRGGKNLEPDHALAARLFRKAADAGDARAAYSLAKMLESGDGVPKDVDGAESWLLRSASAGNRDAILELVLLGKEREIPPLTGKTQSDEIRAFAKDGQSFHVAATPGWAVRGFFDGVVRFYEDRIDIDVEQATLETMANTSNDQRLKSIGVGLGRQGESKIWWWTTDADAPQLSMTHNFPAGVERYTPPTPIHFSIPRDPLTRLDSHWLAFNIVSGTEGNDGTCFAHSEETLLSHERRVSQ